MPPICTIVMIPSGIILTGVIASSFMNYSYEGARQSAPLVPRVRNERQRHDVAQGVLGDKGARIAI